MTSATNATNATGHRLNAVATALTALAAHVQAPAGSDDVAHARYKAYSWAHDQARKAHKSRLAGEAEAWLVVATEAGDALISAQRDPNAGYVDANTRRLAESLCYDVSQLPFRVMRDEAAGRSLYKSWEALAYRLRECAA